MASGTRDDELQGTPAYASPEHIMQEKPDLRTDMYCLGASLFHLMTGEFVYPGETTEEVCRAHVFSPFPIDTLQRHEIPAGWCGVIRKMMEKKPEDRFQDYAEISAALDNIHHYQYGKKMLSVVETVERRAVPRSGGQPETLFDLVPDDMALEGEHLFQLQDAYAAEEVYSALDTRWPVLKLNALEPELRAMQKDSQEDLRSLIQALLLVPSYKETLEELSTFMANASDARPQSDAEKIELVGIERSRNFAMLSIALYRDWQPERPLNWHWLWQHQVYTGLLAEFLGRHAGPAGHRHGISLRRRARHRQARAGRALSRENDRRVDARLRAEPAADRGGARVLRRRPCADRAGVAAPAQVPAHRALRHRLSRGSRQLHRGTGQVEKTQPPCRSWAVRRTRRSTS